MTIISRLIDRVQNFLRIVGLAIWLGGCGQAVAQARQDSKITQATVNLWQAIDDVSKQIPFTQAKIESALDTPMCEVRRNADTIFFQNERPVSLSDGERIAQVDLRLGLGAGDPGFVVLNLDDGCVSLRAVQVHYNDLKISDTPRGRSLDEVTAYSASLPWGMLSFGFTARSPECLASVAFAPKQAKAGGRGE